MARTISRMLAMCRACTLLLMAAASVLHAADPFISDVPDQVVVQDGSTPALFFVVGDPVTAFGALVVTATSDNPVVVPNDTGHLVLPASSNGQRTIQVVPAAGQQGQADITLTVTNDDGDTSTSSFQVLVTGPNTSPVLSGLPGHRIVYLGDAGVQIGFTVSDAETSVGDLLLTVQSSNPALVQNAHITVSGSGGGRQLAIVPESGMTGATVVRVTVTDAAGASTSQRFIWSVVDPQLANYAIRQPSGIFILDSSSGTMVGGTSMRDANIRDLPFVDGYLLRAGWADLEPADGVFDFTMIDNVLGKLPPGQKLSLVIMTAMVPNWLLSVPGVANWTYGSPEQTAPIPWDPIAQGRLQAFLAALAAHRAGTLPLSSDPRLAAINCGVSGSIASIRDPSPDRISEIPGYSRANMEDAVLTHMSTVTTLFPTTPVHIGFWAYNDAEGGIAAWEQLRLAILAQHDGVSHPRVGFWMENLAASRPSADADPVAGVPTTTFGAPMHLSQAEAYTGFQALGCWSRPFNSSHVPKTLNGSPGDAMCYAFTAYESRYSELYLPDLEFADFADELQLWHDFYADLPRAEAGTLQFSVAAFETGTGDAVVTVSRSGGSSGAVSVHYATADGTAVAGVDYTAVSGLLTWGDGDMADKSFVVPIASPAVGLYLELGLDTPLQGAILGGMDDATLTIAADGPGPGTGTGSSGTSGSTNSGTGDGGGCGAGGTTGLLLCWIGVLGLGRVRRQAFSAGVRT